MLSLDGTALTHSGALSSCIGLASPGEKVHLNVWRDHAAHEIDVTLGRVGSEREASASAGVGNGPGKLGLALRPLAKHERAQVYHGTVVQGAESAAAKAGLQAGDVVLAINGRPVDNICWRWCKPALIRWRGGGFADSTEWRRWTQRAEAIDAQPWCCVSYFRPAIAPRRDRA